MFYLKNEILVEGESHFLLNCTKYSHFRTELFNDIGYNPTIAMSNFNCILFFYCQISLRQTSKYLLKVYYLYRQSLLYKNAMHNICIHAWICYNCSDIKAQWAGCFIIFLYYILSYNTCHCNKLFTYLLTYLLTYYPNTPV